MAEENNNQTKIANDQSSAASPPPLPNTTIAPSAPPLSSTAPYLESSGAIPGATTSPANNSFLATAVPSVPSTPLTPSEDLTKLKQQALQNLAPLINKLDQPPEERFKTLMMMIQASDNPQYLDQAYQAASSIKDEKEKARALLDIVNEINYFTQPKNELKNK